MCRGQDPRCTDSDLSDEYYDTGSDYVPSSEDEGAGALAYMTGASRGQVPWHSASVWGPGTGKESAIMNGDVKCKMQNGAM